MTPEYAERIYAGVLGKMIGVYLGRPFEGWTYERIQKDLGDVRYYVNDHPTAELRHRRLIVTDDDLAGTFIFPRALTDNGCTPELSSAQIGDTWLNYIVENHSILWWGGIGTSTEQTVFSRLREGIRAPLSGAIETNGQTLAEQIGAQIFIDGWALASPNNPDRAVRLAREAARVSHDGVAVEAAVLLAAMEALAFEERNLDALLDRGLFYVAKDSSLRPLIADIRKWHADDGDWRRTRERIAEKYGYDKYGGICHVIPNHALIIMALLYGELDFSRSLEIICTSGWDTDCNAGNVGCLVAIAGGLASLGGGADWRGPLKDRLYLSCAEGGRAITDAVIEAHSLIRMACALDGSPAPELDKGARFNFAFPGSVQGFGSDESTTAGIVLENVQGHSRTGARSLAIHFKEVSSDPARAMTRTFAKRDEFDMRSYDLLCSPTLYSGQMVEAEISVDVANTGPVAVAVSCDVFGEGDALSQISSAEVTLSPGEIRKLSWTVPDTGGQPILNVGVAVRGAKSGMVSGAIYVDYIRWSGAPSLVLRRPAAPSTMWTRSWATSVDRLASHPEAIRLSQGNGLGMAIQGTREWRDYSVSSDLIPSLGRTWGLAARVQGLRRYYAVLFESAHSNGLGGGIVRLVRVSDTETVLAETDMPWALDQVYHVDLKVKGTSIEASIDGKPLLRAVDDSPSALDCGAIALMVCQGTLATNEISIQPL